MKLTDVISTLFSAIIWLLVATGKIELTTLGWIFFGFAILGLIGYTLTAASKEA